MGKYIWDSVNPSGCIALDILYIGHLESAISKLVILCFTRCKLKSWAKKMRYIDL